MKVCLLLLKLATPVHEFYDDACCAGRDCHPVPCEEITSVDNGWQWRGLLFTKGTLHDAPDGNCHVCVAPAFPAFSPVHPTCIYLPPRT